MDFFRFNCRRGKEIVSNDSDLYGIHIIGHDNNEINVNDPAIDRVIQEITGLYRNVYGDPPWNEYRVCNAGHKSSVIDVYGVNGDLDELESSRFVSDFSCPHDACGHETELYYPRADLVELFREQFQKEIVASIAVNRTQQRLAGAALGWFSTLDQGWDDKVIAGAGDQAAEDRQPFDEFIAEAREFFTRLGVSKIDGKIPIFNSADWFVRDVDRPSGIALPLLRDKYDTARIILGCDAPVLGHTIPGSEAHEWFSRIGFLSGESLPLGICRVYSTLDILLDGIDNLPKSKQYSLLPPRHTDVVELTCNTAIGADENGAKKVKEFLTKAANLLGKKPLREPETHLSPLYGFSGWLPLKGSQAVHLYAWDNDDSMDPPFVSVDVSSSIDPDQSDRFVSLCETFFGAEQSVYKTTTDNSEWVELAPNIVRQRLNVRAKISSKLSMQEMKTILDELCVEIEMTQISEPIFIEESDGCYSCWMHWETSGTVVYWDNEGNFSIDIYTCKSFSVESAIGFLRKSLGMNRYTFQSY